MNDTTVGYLLVSARTADGVLLVPSALVRVYDQDGALLYEGLTNRDGYTDEIEVITPPKENSLSFGKENPYATVSISVEKDGFYPMHYPSVPIFPFVVTIQQSNLQPSVVGALAPSSVSMDGGLYE